MVVKEVHKESNNQTKNGRAEIEFFVLEFAQEIVVSAFGRTK